MSIRIECNWLPGRVLHQKQCQEKCETSGASCVGIRYKEFYSAITDCSICTNATIAGASKRIGFYRRPKGKCAIGTVSYNTTSEKFSKLI